MFTSKPTELTRFATAAELDDHLFAQLVPAVLKQHQPAGRQYAAPEVTRWLTTLARHLAWQGECGGSRSDLQLDLLWPVAGRRAPRYAAMATTTTAASSLLTLGVLPRWPPDKQPVVGLVVFVVVAAWMALRPKVDLRRLTLSGLRTSVGRRRIGLLLVVGLVGGLMLAAVSNVVGLVGRLMLTFECGGVGLLGAVLVLLSSGPATRPAVIDRPARLVQQGLVYTIAGMVAFSFGLVLVGEVGAGLAAGTVGELVAGLGTLLAFGIVFGRTGGLAVALAVGLNSGAAVGPPFAVVALVVGLIFVADSPWLRYLFAALLLARQGDLPRRPAVFMDWAHEAGLMRLSGIAVQFRHREFQTWLATRGQ